MTSTKAARPVGRKSVAPESVSKLTWTFRVDGVDIDWSWERDGHPPVDRLAPTRKAVSSKRSHHVASTVYSMTNGDFVIVESGLEHDLLRKVDRDPRTRRIVAQPFKLSWGGPEPTSHFPDLLTLWADGITTVWDVKAPERQDDDFWMKVEVTRKACEIVGWHHEVFSGFGPTERLNFLWLSTFRRRPLWNDQWENQVVAAAGRPEATLGSIMGCDDGSGELIAVMWYQMWRGALTADIEAQWTLDTPVALDPQRPT